MNKIEEIQNEYDNAPEILLLNNNEKFKDKDGNILDIEVRGNKKHNEIYFKVKDVSKCFEKPNINQVILDKDRNGYILNKHYKFFIIQNSTNALKNTTKKELYLTYTGMIRLLFVSRNKYADYFQEWATKILFTIQIGTQKQKIKLSKKIAGINAIDIKNYFKLSKQLINCVYLYSLNTVKELRTPMNISNIYPDDYLICKFGRSEDLQRRNGEHIITYNNIENVELNLLYYTFIEERFNVDAESNLKKYFETINCKFEFETYNELIIINPKNINNIKEQYDLIANMYNKNIKMMTDEINLLKNDIIMLSTQLKQEKTNYIKDTKIFELENKLLAKELEKYIC